VGEKKRSVFVVFLALVIIAEVGATPSINKSGCLSPLSITQCTDAHVQFVSNPPQLVNSANLGLNEIGAEFLKPPIGFTNSTTSSQAGVNVKSLPAIPAAFLMVLAGFLCVSWVKDRKVWMAAVASLLYLGLAGFNAVPQLLPRLHTIRHIKQSSSSKAAAYIRELENSFRWRCDVEGTRYIGLLHHLMGIPDGESAAANQRGRLVVHGHACKARVGLRGEYALAAVQNSYHLEFSPACPAAKAERRVCFSQTFAYIYLPHGPPEII
jgi:hypothetical protein